MNVMAFQMFEITSNLTVCVIGFQADRGNFKAVHCWPCFVRRIHHRPGLLWGETTGQCWISLINSGRVTHICISKLGQHCVRWCLVAGPAPSHYLNQCWNIVNWTLRNKLQWNLNENSHIFIQGKASENVIWQMAAILFRPHVLRASNTESISMSWCQAASVE